MLWEHVFSLLAAWVIKRTNASLLVSPWSSIMPKRKLVSSCERYGDFSADNKCKWTAVYLIKKQEGNKKRCCSVARSPDKPKSRQAILSCTSEITETIRIFLQIHLQDHFLSQIGFLHPNNAMFRTSVNTGAREGVQIYQQSKMSSFRLQVTDKPNNPMANDFKKNPFSQSKTRLWRTVLIMQNLSWW